MIDVTAYLIIGFSDSKKDNLTNILSDYICDDNKWMVMEICNGEEETLYKAINLSPSFNRLIVIRDIEDTTSTARNLISSLIDNPREHIKFLMTSSDPASLEEVFVKKCWTYHIGDNND